MPAPVSRTHGGHPLSTFTLDAAAALSGPDWLRKRRADAAERVATTPFPTADEEVWRYSRIADLDLDALQPVSDGAPPPSGVPPAVEPVLAAVGERSALAVLLDGRLAHLEVDAGLAEQGLEVGPVGGVPGGDGLVGSVAGRAVDLFGELNAAFAPDPLVVRVPAGMEVPHPVVVIARTTLEGTAGFPHLVVSAGAGARVNVVDHQDSDDVYALTVPLVEIDVGEAAHVGYLNAQQLGPRVWQVGRQVSRVAAGAHLVTAMAAFGGDYARLRVESSLDGPGSRGDMLAVYFGEGAQMHDFRTLQRHAAPNCTSDLLFKGAVEDRARSVYTGLIRVEKGARGTNAFQTNRNIKLSREAWAESVPNLEIENNDVRCSHASTVGPIDEDQLFYLQSRGVPPHVAERLVVTGFFDEVLEQLPVPGLAGPLRDEVTRKFARRGR